MARPGLSTDTETNVSQFDNKEYGTEVIYSNSEQDSNRRMFAEEQENFRDWWMEFETSFTRW